MREFFENLDSDTGLGSPQARAIVGGETTRNPGLDWARLRRLLSQRWRTSLVLAGGCAALGALAVVKKFEPTFRGEALLKVEATQPRIAYADEEWRARSIAGFYNHHVRTFLRIAKTREVLVDAITRLVPSGLAWLPEGIAQEDAPAHLGARVNVSIVRDSHLMTVGFDDQNPALVAPVANAVAEALVHQVREEDDLARAHLMEVIEAERARLESDLAGNHKALEALSTQVGSSLIHDQGAVYAQRLVRLQEGLTKVIVERTRAEGAWVEAQDRAKSLLESLPEGQLEALVDLDDAVRDARVLCGRLMRDEERETGHLAAEHPARQQSLARLASARRQVQETERAAQTRLRRRLLQERQEQAQEVVSTARSRKEAAHESEQLMRREVLEAKQQLLAYSQALTEATELRDLGTQIKEALRRLSERGEQLRVEAGAPSRIRIASFAVTPRKPSKDMRKVLLVMVAMLSGTAGLAVGALLELLSDLARDPGDLALPLPVEEPSRALVRLAARLRTEEASLPKVAVLGPGGSGFGRLLSDLLPGARCAPAEHDLDQLEAQLEDRDLVLETGWPLESPIPRILADRGVPLLLIAERNRSRRRDVLECLEQLRDANVLGVVLTDPRAQGSNL